MAPRRRLTYQYRGEYEISEAIDLLIRSGRTIDAIGIDGWRADVGYPEDRDRAEALLRGEESIAVDSRKGRE